MNLDFFNNLGEKLKENNKFVKNFLNELEEHLEKNNNYRIENHLYMVEEDRNGKVFLTDITNGKAGLVFEEKDFPQKLINQATEGTVFQYKNGEYHFYSRNGFERIYRE